MHLRESIIGITQLFQDTLLLLFAISSSEVMDSLTFHLELCVRKQAFSTPHRQVKEYVLYHLSKRLETFVFRKDRSDLKLFRTWFHILYLITLGEDLSQRRADRGGLSCCEFYEDPSETLFIASTQGILNSSQAGHEEERNSVKKLLSM